MNARDKSYDLLVAALLDPAEAATYLAAVIELDDPAALALALRQVTNADSPHLAQPATPHPRKETP